MSDDVSTQQQPGFWRRFLALKTLLVTFSMVALLASNVVSLVSAGAHDFMHSALLRVLLIGGQSFADRAMSNSPKQKFDQVMNEKTADLDARNKRLTDANKLQAKQLQEGLVQNQKLAHQLDANGKQAKATVATVHQRLAKGVSRNVMALPAEPIPYLGLVVTLAVTSLDIYDACQTMKDFNSLLRMMGQGEENVELCGRKVPTVDEVLASAKTEGLKSAERIAKEAREIKIPVPEIRLPTLVEVSKVVCSWVPFPGLCPKK